MAVFNNKSAIFMIVAVGTLVDLRQVYCNINVSSIKKLSLPSSRKFTIIIIILAILSAYSEACSFDIIQAYKNICIPPMT